MKSTPTDRSTGHALLTAGGVMILISIIAMAILGSADVRNVPVAIHRIVEAALYGGMIAGVIGMVVLGASR